MNFVLDGLNHILGINLLRSIFARQGLDENLHTAMQEDETENRLLLNVVVGERPIILKLFAREYQT